MRKIALIPVYNEETTLLSVLRDLSPEVDRIVIVDDGSRDGSFELAREWARGRPEAALLRLPENRGMSEALREGFLYLADGLTSGEFGPEDILLTLDADGQHDSREIAALCRHMESNGLDVGLTRRDFSLYPWHKRLGNRLMTAWGAVWSGFPYADVESGFRAVRLKVLPRLLEYYLGRRYSCAQEIAVLTARLGFRVDNSFVTMIRLYRSQTGYKDVAVNALFGFRAFVRWALRLKVPRRTGMRDVHQRPQSRGAIGADSSEKTGDIVERPSFPAVSHRQRVLDHLLFPVNMWMSESASRRLGLTPLDHERIRAALPCCRGRLLDVGCGNNLLVRAYGNGIGIDIHPYREIAVRCDSSLLPFKCDSFDSVALLACLNHMVRRREALEECRRVLRRGGRVIITMIPAWVGFFSHPIRKRHDPDQLDRGIAEEESLGMSNSEVRALLEQCGMRLMVHRRFMWGLNNLYVAEKD